MTLRDDLLRAAVNAELPPALIVKVHRVAPLIEFARDLDAAVASTAVITAAVAERTTELAEQLKLVRQHVHRLEAQIVALGVEPIPARGAATVGPQAATPDSGLRELPTPGQRAEQRV